MVNSIIRFFKRGCLSAKLHRIESLIAAKRYSEASVVAFIGLQDYPNHPELLALKSQAEQGATS